MCSQQSGALVSAYHGLKVPNPAAAAAAAANPFVFHPSMTQAAFEFHRAQLYDYNARLHFGLRAYPGSGALAPYSAHGPHDPLAHYYQSKYDPRTRFVHEEPKPSHSYIGLIAMAILASKEMKLVLADIYQWILDNYVYFRNRGPGWRNSIRHNLSLNDCFIKAGRSANGKGHYWAIHPANVEDFKKGDFRRRKAQRKVRRHMGLSVPDDEDSPSPPPAASTDSADWASKVLGREESAVSPPSREDASRPDSAPTTDGGPSGSMTAAGAPLQPGPGATSTPTNPRGPSASVPGKKRLFDVESLLAPETNNYSRPYDISHVHVAKMQKTTIIITPESPGSPQETTIPQREETSANRNNSEGRELDVDDENIDVEDMGDTDEVFSANGSTSGRRLEEANARSSSVSPGPAASPASSGPSALPLTPRDDRPASAQSAASSRASPPTPGSTANGISPAAGDPIQIRTAGSLALQSSHRGPWSGMVTSGWRDGHPSAFHSTGNSGGGSGAPSTLPSWGGGVGPHTYPLMAAPFPIGPGTHAAEALAAQQRWQETFSRMMGRPLEPTKSNLKSEA